MTSYDKLLKEVRTKVAAFQSSTAKEYVLPMYNPLRNEEPPLSPGDARDRIEKDCIAIWKKRTILKFLPSEAKDPEKQKSGRLGQKKRKFAAEPAAPFQKKEEIVIDTEGNPITTLISTSRDHDGLRQSDSQDELVDDGCHLHLEFPFDRDNIWQHLIFRAFNQDKILDHNVRFSVVVNKHSLQVISTRLWSCSVW